MSSKEFSWKAGGGGERRTHSFLVRLWLEPREEEGESVVIRGYFRNLQTGEEHFVTEPKAIAELLERSIEVAEERETGFPKRSGRSGEIPPSG